MRMPMRRSGCPPTYDVVKDDGEIVTPDQYGFETSDAAKARADAQEHIWNDIWKRRIVYFATVGATFWLLVFPLISGAQRSDEFISRIRWVSDIIRFVGGFPARFRRRPGSTDMRARRGQFAAVMPGIVAV